jgi:uncharacterized protein (TIGR02452 family)
LTKENNIRIFYDTMKKIKTENILKDAVKHSIENQTVILEKDSVDFTQNKKHSYNTNVVLSKKRTFEASKDYAKQGKKVCVLNFASSTNPGGGVDKGSSAQEECLCRCSTLYPCLKSSDLMDKFYVPHRKKGDPLYDDDIIYTPDVVVVRDDTNEENVFSSSEQYKVDVVTCAAPNLRSKPSNYYNPNAGWKPAQISKNDLFALLKKRIRRILSVCEANGAEVVVLGAFGCGAFCNPPKMVAKAFEQVLQEFDGSFDTIEFAVYCPPHKEENYEAFDKVFNS